MNRFNTYAQCCWGIGVMTSCLLSLLPTVLLAETLPTPEPASSSSDGTILRYQSSQTSSMGDFSDTGAPRSRGSAGSRGECQAPSEGVEPQQKSSPTALIPLAKGTINEQIIDVPFARTVSRHPTFWFKFAQSQDAIKSLDLTLVDEATQELVQEIRGIPRISQTPDDDVWGVQWPQTATALEVDRTYRWFLVIQCDNTVGSGILLSGLVQRQALSTSMAQQLSEADARERVFLYANNGIWHEALTELRQAMQDNPNDPALQADWSNLLDSVDL